MGREGAASPKGLSGTGDGPSIKILLHLRRPLGVKSTALAAAVVALLGIVAFAATREATVTGRAPSTALSRPESTPQRPAFTRASYRPSTIFAESGATAESAAMKLITPSGIGCPFQVTLPVTR